MINSTEQLTEFLPLLGAAEWVALDTEADSLHAYPEKLCLLQISLASGDYLIDPLARIDLSALWPELKKHQIIMHGSDYDLRLLRKNHCFVPERIFDTMLASRLLGEKEFGLTNLVGKILSVTLEKGSQKADWARRPLTPKMETYAKNDTHYLKSLSDIIKNQLIEKNRLSWLEESCSRLIAECAVTPTPEPDRVWRTKGSHKLSRAALAVLRELWRWREKEAIGANRPPFFVLSHEPMASIAMAAADNQPFDEFIPRHLSSRRRDGLQEAVATGLAVPAEEHPDYLRNFSRRQTDAEQQQFQELEAKRNQRAEELVIDPTLIASRATLLALSSDWAGHQVELMNWQRELLSKS